jgi:hypothetical protein
MSVENSYEPRVLVFGVGEGGSYGFPDCFPVYGFIWVQVSEPVGLAVGPQVGGFRVPLLEGAGYAVN